MRTSSITQKGQVTIPIELRLALNLHSGDIVEFKLSDNTVILMKRKNDIKSAFGIVKVKTKVSLEEMEEAIAKGANQ